MKGFIAFMIGLMLMFGDISPQRSATCFTQQEISDSLFACIYGKSFKEDCTTAREDLRYLRVLHYNKVGEVLQGKRYIRSSLKR